MRRSDQAADWAEFAALMLSPGVPLTHPKPHWTVSKAKAAGVEIAGRHRAVRPHGERRARAQEAQDRRHHRHQRQVDDDGPDRPRLPPGRPRHAGGRQYRRGRAGPGRHARRRGLRAGAIVLSAGPDLQPARRRGGAAEHLARPPGPSRRHGRLHRRQAPGAPEPGQGRHRHHRRRRSLVPADLHRDHRRQPPHHLADQRRQGHGPGRLRPAGRAATTPRASG